MKIEEKEVYKIIDKKIVEACNQYTSKTKSTVFMIGGVVRDLLLGLDVKKDVDLVTDGDGVELAHFVADYLNKNIEVTFFKRFGTAMFFYKRVQYEWIGARKESYIQETRNPIVSKGTLIDDQLRRDFTINAMAISLQKEDFGDVIDPFDGAGDLYKKVIKTPINPDTTFFDDPLRILRAIRFACQLQFEISESCFLSIKKNAHRIKILDKGRVCTELQKIVSSDFPQKGFLLLEKANLLEIILPEISQLKGVEEVDGIGHKDNFYHTCEVLQNTVEHTNNIWLRWAALFHDIGKPKSKKFIKNIGWTFHFHETIGANMIKKIFLRLGLSKDKINYVSLLIKNSSRLQNLTSEDTSESSIRRLVLDMGDYLEDLFVLQYSDITTKNLSKKELYRKQLSALKIKVKNLIEKDKLRNWKNPATGELIMSIFDIKPSKEIGTLKESVKEAIIEGNLGGDIQEIKAYLLCKGIEMGLKTK